MASPIKRKATSFPEGNPEKKPTSERENTICNICYEAISHGEILIAHNAKRPEEQKDSPEVTHSFHFDCLKPWLRDHTNCPSCRFAWPHSVVSSIRNALVPKCSVEDLTKKALSAGMPEEALLEIKTLSKGVDKMVNAVRNQLIGAALNAFFESENINFYSLVIDLYLSGPISSDQRESFCLCASELGLIEFLNLMLSDGISEASKIECLRIAIEQEETEVARALIASGPIDDRHVKENLLPLSIERDNVEAFRLFLDSFAVREDQLAVYKERSELLGSKNILAYLATLEKN